MEEVVLTKEADFERMRGANEESSDEGGEEAMEELPTTAEVRNAVAKRLLEKDNDALNKNENGKSSVEEEDGVESHVQFRSPARTRGYSATPALQEEEDTSFSPPFRSRRTASVQMARPSPSSPSRFPHSPTRRRSSAAISVDNEVQLLKGIIAEVKRRHKEQLVKREEAERAAVAGRANAVDSMANLNVLFSLIRRHGMEKGGGQIFVGGWKGKMKKRGFVEFSMWRMAVSQTRAMREKVGLFYKKTFRRTLQSTWRRWKAGVEALVKLRHSTEIAWEKFRLRETGIALRVLHAWTEVVAESREEKVARNRFYFKDLERRFYSWKDKSIRTKSARMRAELMALGTERHLRAATLHLWAKNARLSREEREAQSRRARAVNCYTQLNRTRIMTRPFLVWSNRAVYNRQRRNSILQRHRETVRGKIMKDSMQSWRSYAVLKSHMRQMISRTRLNRAFEHWRRLYVSKKEHNHIEEVVDFFLPRIPYRLLPNTLAQVKGKYNVSLNNCSSQEKLSLSKAWEGWKVQTEVAMRTRENKLMTYVAQKKRSQQILLSRRAMWSWKQLMRQSVITASALSAMMSRIVFNFLGEAFLKWKKDVADNRRGWTLRERLCARTAFRCFRAWNARTRSCIESRAQSAKEIAELKVTHEDIITQIRTEYEAKLAASVLERDEALAKVETVLLAVNRLNWKLENPSKHQLNAKEKVEADVILKNGGLDGSVAVWNTPSNTSRNRRRLNPKASWY